ncbi:glycosyltransferase family 2 protein [Aeromonas enteropelogenes]|uniref:glycosyltransferase family 2 protein n=1 Tax=Aeromonas enteropelogenes TaxID=29489 RepID=UPI003B9DF52D
MVSIILLNYNSSKYSIKCIESILKSDYQQFEIIVVDNNSSPTEIKILIAGLEEINCDKIRFIKNKINHGFAMGNVIGANSASGDYILFLNNDTTIEKNALKELVSYMEGNCQVSLSIPAIFESDGRRTASFSYLPGIINSIFGDKVYCALKGRDFPDRKKEYSKPIYVEMGSGAAMFFRKSDYFKIGGFDSNYFLYCEEEDICLRLQREGMKVSYVPSSKIMHFGGGSTKRNVNIEKEFYISLFYLLSKNYSVLSSSIIKFKFIFKELMRCVRFRGRWQILFFMIFSANLCNSMRHYQNNIYSK